MAKKKSRSKKPATDRQPSRPSSKADRAAELRRELARLEDSDDSDDDQGDQRFGLTTLAERGQIVTRAIEQGLNALGNLGKLMVGDETAANERGDTVKFTRHAGRVRGVRLDGQGRVKEVDYAPEEWPPRREGF